MLIWHIGEVEGCMLRELGVWDMNYLGTYADRVSV